MLLTITPEARNPELKSSGEASELRAGDWVTVRSKEEILRTLDRDGQLDGMPFMPEMFAFCGQRFQVHKRAHKTCDTVFPTRGRRVSDAVHLETRCSGQAHGGCQAGCLLFWKVAWLKHVDESTVSVAGPPVNDSQYGNPHGRGCTEEDVYRAARHTPDSNAPDP